MKADTSPEKVEENNYTSSQKPLEATEYLDQH